jgi:hypothetical protein
VDSSIVIVWGGRNAVSFSCFLKGFRSSKIKTGGIAYYQDRAIGVGARHMVIDKVEVGTRCGEEVLVTMLRPTRSRHGEWAVSRTHAAV